MLKELEAYLEAPGLQKVNVLLLDGSEQAATLLKEMLGQFGLTNCYIAHNGFEGLRILREARIDLILTDCGLKVGRIKSDARAQKEKADEILPLNGVDFVKRLRRETGPAIPHIPVIMMAADDEQIQAAYDAGVNEICAKPLNAQEFGAKIKAVIDTPRPFIATPNYRGPCRRRVPQPSPSDKERRYRDIHVVPSRKFRLAKVK